MKLLEHEGKALLSRHAIAVPDAALWPQLPPSPTGWAIKAQVLAGGRGKQGGIRMAASADDVARIASAMQASRLGAEPVHAVLIERKLDIARELYLAAFVNRDRGRVTMMASAAGGIDIEQVPKSEIASIDVDPLVGLAGLTMALGVLQKAHCFGKGWNTPDQFWHACYSDLPIVYQSSGLGHSMPYLPGAQPLDQPLVSGLAMCVRVSGPWRLSKFRLVDETTRCRGPKLSPPA